MSTDGAVLQVFIEKESITVAAGMPQVWMTLFKYMEHSGRTLAGLECAIIGGSAAPPYLLEGFTVHGARPLQVGSNSNPNPKSTAE